MEDIINNIKIRLQDLGFNPEDFLEIKKYLILSIISKIILIDGFIVCIEYSMKLD